MIVKVIGECAIKYPQRHCAGAPLVGRSPQLFHQSPPRPHPGQPRCHHPPPRGTDREGGRGGVRRAVRGREGLRQVPRRPLRRLHHPVTPSPPRPPSRHPRDCPRSTRRRRARSFRRHPPPPPVDTEQRRPPPKTLGNSGGAEKPAIHVKTPFFKLHLAGKVDKRHV